MRPEKLAIPISRCREVSFVMDIIFRGQHIEIPNQFKSYANDHLAKINRYLPSADHAIVDVRREARGDEGRFVVQVTVNANGSYLRAEERNFESGCRWRPRTRGLNCPPMRSL
jgi:ribosomal subunit interface protein